MPDYLRTRLCIRDGLGQLLFTRGVLICVSANSPLRVA